jgi:hypothetical protein
MKRHADVPEGGASSDGFEPGDLRIIAGVGN